MSRRASVEFADAMTMDAGLDARFVEHAYWLLLGRAATATELRDETRHGGADAARTFLMRLTSAPEAAALRRSLLAVPDWPGASAYEQHLRALGGNREFVARSYESLLGRPADAGGLQHYSQALDAG